MQKFLHTLNILVVKSFPNNPRNGNIWQLTNMAWGLNDLIQAHKRSTVTKPSRKTQGTLGSVVCDSHLWVIPELTYSAWCQKWDLSDKMKILDPHMSTDPAIYEFLTSSDQHSIENVLMQQIPISPWNSFIPVNSAVISVCIKCFCIFGI